MAKKRKGKKRRDRSQPQVKPRGPHGFDFGCLPRAMALGSLEFPNQLGAASIVGVGYGEGWSEDLNATVPSVTLIAQKEQPLVDAFSTFSAWAAATDPDSLELTIILRSSGGYLLALSPERQRLEQRCLGFDRTHVAVTVAATWVKPIDTVHPFLRQFKDYARGPVAPFFLDGAVYTGAHGMPATPSHIREVSGLNPLLKFEATIVDEADVQPDTAAAVALSIASPRSSRKGGSEPTQPSPLVVAQERVRSLRTHFPVSLERFRSSEAVAVLMREIAPTGIQAWQVEQALCNLVLSGAICNDVHYRCLSASKTKDSIITALRDRYEVADNQPVVDVAGDVLRAQVLADTNALLRYFKLRSAKTMEIGLEALQHASLLDAPTAVSDVPSSWKAAL